MNIKLLIVSVLAVVLIGLYGYAMVDVVKTASECSKKDEKTEKTVECKDKEKELNEGSLIIFSGVGGLVAAFALGFLAVAQTNIPNEGLESVIAPEKNSISETITKAIPLVFVLTWLVCGMLAVFYGLMKYSGVIPPLTEMGKVWIGTAIAGIGAFWGIKTK